MQLYLHFTLLQVIIIGMDNTGYFEGESWRNSKGTVVWPRGYGFELWK